MVQKLKDLLQFSYCPWSHFRVAAIAIDDQGREWPGVNVENAAFPSGLCAERSALFGSVAHGAKVGTFKEIYVISSGEGVISPCAGCRQVMTEFMTDDSLVHLFNGAGDIKKTFKLGELVPLPIRSEQIK
ncbi:Cytidine deaminase (Cytidine aminohydrolase) [Mycoplasmopsis californica HAZ160_1]|uniref:Cytidine deaminase n=1 Tax=Mycoplasmopsis californica HAZ160_1 TaxID=1397850 RepID=A0AAT9F7F0_9BACT|nr:cytidine deaminase [Mycoplasmopsis californica]BAP00818.1 Cytidine deaminase (Cytidine aminohydrolase) [Mycoplasmopsis californica HAZ160_1]BBG40673.1 cytidine deaminase [Mycoplasmopsis californica]BBG41268.1 cytidine deaminase [Mycoplasmopsis californica]BBG41861.1 cytidine deaminase [Mycoplasmopsis californica]BBG42454.1 cytidine deaminase [Mycoplasmopsis californica]